MRAAQYLSLIAGSQQHGDPECSEALLVHAPDRCGLGPVGVLGSGLQAAAPAAIAASLAGAGARRRRRGGGSAAGPEPGLGRSVGSGPGPLVSSASHTASEAVGRVGAERGVKGPVHVGLTTVLTMHFGPCYLGPDLVHLVSATDVEGVGTSCVRSGARDRARGLL